MGKLDFSPGKMKGRLASIPRRHVQVWYKLHNPLSSRYLVKDLMSLSVGAE
jgi:hypothetical protein